ncbi:hypothetical protein GPECTOR_12g514 [Gonium pectorale]|uniref:Uncharacterized protein n=1 Tax=Gonium pectorale TaxID=33097 RepID=A0A150GP16_GONPE|nr:hypothetical protein GPECTOR_12g514 [Gonium pectorale]|eukprot:KXZ51551.1 hypothetical protein GPECTOR_12g514 [Gonium pectorale]
MDLPLLTDMGAGTYNDVYDDEDGGAADSDDDGPQRAVFAAALSSQQQLSLMAGLDLRGARGGGGGGGMGGVAPAPRRRPRLLAARRAAGSPGGQPAGAAAAASPASGTGDGQAAAATSETGGWRLMVAAPSPHNPESLATLLMGGRLVNPRTAVPAPLLAAATAPSPPQRQGAGAASEVPATAVVRCAAEAEAAAALALHGRPVYCPPTAPGGPASWRPLTVLLQAAPPSGVLPPQQPHGGSSWRAPRERQPGPSVRRAILTGLPSHLGGADLTGLFGSGLLLPGQHATPEERRFLLLCPDSISFRAVLSWDGARLPDKPVDALQQIVPRVRGWAALRVECDWYGKYGWL